MLQGHGDDGYRFGVPVNGDFSTNVYYGGPPPGLKEHLFAAWEKVARYPEVLAESLSSKIADHYKLPAGHVLVTNGSTESIYLIAQAYGNSRSAILTPAFAEYEDACRMYGHDVHFIDWKEVGEGFKIKADLLFICNPNNPTGAIFEDLLYFVSVNQNTLFIIDEAFIEFTLSINSVVDMVTQYDNLIVLRSMTKVYSIPGLRLGYIVGHPKLITHLTNFKLPWTVNVMALEAGRFIFDHLDQIRLPLLQMLADRADFANALTALSFPVSASHTHFFIAESPIFSAAELKLYLLNNHGLLIRDAGNFRGLSKRHFRVATLTPAKNALLINVLAEWKHPSSL
jgi:threonine-phosphate decarboxylase